MSATLLPLFEGEVSGWPARVEYQPVPTVAFMQLGWSTPMKNITVFNAELYERVTAKHVREWATVAAVAASSIVLPLLVWIRIQLKYVGGLPKAASKEKKRF